MDVTFSYALTPRELRQSLRTWSYIGTLRASAVGLPVAVVGAGWLAWQDHPGAARGWALIVTLLGVAILAAPHMMLTRGLSQARRVGAEQPVCVTLSDACLRYEHDGLIMEVARRRVRDVRASADCWLISYRGGSAALVLPKRAIPPELQTEVTHFLSGRRRRGPVT